MKTPEHIYRPSCARCRDEAGKDRAGVLDTSLCNWHTNDLVLTLRAEHERLREALREIAEHVCIWRVGNGPECRRCYSCIARAALAEVGK